MASARWPKKEKGQTAKVIYVKLPLQMAFVAVFKKTLRRPTFEKTASSPRLEKSRRDGHS